MYAFLYINTSYYHYCYCKHALHLRPYLVKKKKFRKNVLKEKIK